MRLLRQWWQRKLCKQAAEKNREGQQSQQADVSKEVKNREYAVFYHADQLQLLNSCTYTNKKVGESKI